MVGWRLTRLVHGLYATMQGESHVRATRAHHGPFLVLVLLPLLMLLLLLLLLMLLLLLLLLLLLYAHVLVSCGRLIGPNLPTFG